MGGRLYLVEPAVLAAPPRTPDAPIIVRGRPDEPLRGLCVAVAAHVRPVELHLVRRDHALRHLLIAVHQAHNFAGRPLVAARLALDLVALACTRPHLRSSRSSPSRRWRARGGLSRSRRRRRRSRLRRRRRQHTRRPGPPSPPRIGRSSCGPKGRGLATSRCGPKSSRPPKGTGSRRSRRGRGRRP